MTKNESSLPLQGWSFLSKIGFFLNCAYLALPRARYAQGRNKKLVLLCAAFLSLTYIYGSTARAQSFNDGLTIKAKTFEISFEQSHYYLVWPFQNFITIEIRVKNTGGQADTIEFLPPSSIPEGWRVRIEGSVYLQPGESGYQTYYENELNPQAYGELTRNIYLTPLQQTADFQSAWLEKAEYPGVLRVVASKDWNYLAAGIGKHPDPWDPKVFGSTNVYFFGVEEGLIWEYPVRDTVWGIDVNQDGSLVAAGSDSGNLYIIDRAGKLVWQYNARTDLREVKFSNSGAYLGAETMPSQIFNTLNGEVTWQYQLSVNPWWRGVAFSQDDKYVVYAGDFSLLLLDIENKKLVWQREIGGVPYDVMLTPDLSRIVVADKGDNLWSYDGEGNLLWHQSYIHVLTDAAMSEDGSRIATLSHNGIVRMFNGEGELLWRRAIGSGGHNGIDITADGKYIVVGGGSKESPYEVFLLDKDGDTLWRHSNPGPIPEPYHPYLISAMSTVISDDGSYIAAGYGAGNPGIQLFAGKITAKAEGEAKKRRGKNSAFA